MAVWVYGHLAGFVRERVLLIVAICLLSGLAGCGGGGGVDLAGGQGPDPVVLDVPIAYVKRPLARDVQGIVNQSSDIRELITFDIGADLYVRDRASPSAPETNITANETQGLGDVRDLSASFDGQRILFAMRAQFIEGANEEDQPTWNIWEYNLGTKILRRIFESDITAEAGHDVAPHYLPDGRIIFASTRQRQSNAILLDEGKPQFAALDEDGNEFTFSLHVMNDDGSDIHQVSFNQSHDTDPLVLGDGRIAFTRWDNMGGRNAFNIYSMNPDGTDQQLLYGANSHATGTDGATIQFSQPHEMLDGQIMALIRPFSTTTLGGAIVTIDVANYLEDTQPAAMNRGILSGPAQVVATVNDVRTDGSISPGGMFSSIFPLWDGTDRIFVSWSQCRILDQSGPVPLPVPCTAALLADPASVTADPLYGIWIYSQADGTQLPVVPPVEGMMFTDIIAAQPLDLPPVIFDQDKTGALDPTLISEGVGLLNIRSVYDIDGVDTAVPSIPALADPGQTLASDRPARFLRIVKAVSIPDDNVLDFANTAFGRSTGQGMREIIGYVPVEPDGSVQVKVPANVALAISVVDEFGQRISPRHQNWLQVHPGEVLSCNGCHATNTGESHGRADAFDSMNAGALTTSAPFPNTDPAIFADFGETMAEARGRISCATDCADITPTVDVVYEDIWTDEAAAGRVKDAPFAYTYAGLLTPPPASLLCQGTWTNQCRVVINYKTHIQSLWDFPRLAQDGVTDITCTLCHNNRDAAGVLQVPAGQLELTDDPSADEPDHFLSYRELLFADNEQELVMGALQDRMIEIGIDPVTGNPILVPVSVGRSMSTAGSLASGVFFARFRAGGTHENYLTDDELRLISEWLDIGGQYFNNPFDAPLN